MVSRVNLAASRQVGQTGPRRCPTLQSPGSNNGSRRGISTTAIDLFHAAVAAAAVVAAENRQG